MARLLFFPYSHGVGFGYVGRLIAIAEQLRDAKHTCIFAADAREGLVAQAGFEVCASKTRHGTAVPDMGSRQGSYIAIDNIDTAFGIARYYLAERVRADVAEDLAVIDFVKPDAVVIDMQPTGAIAARVRGVPLLSIGDSDTVRDEANSWMPWLGEGTANILPYPSVKPAFNAVLGEYGLAPVEHVTDILWGDKTLLATTPELEASLPPLNVRGRLEYIGPVYWDPPDANCRQALESFGRDADARIYITLGHGGKANADQVSRVLAGCDDPRWALYVSRGFRINEFPALPSNATAGEFTGLSAPLAWADVVINHGGHGTVLATLLHGKPSLVIPFMSEQEANGRVFVEDHNAGFLLRRTRRSPSAKKFTYHLRYSGTSLDGTFEPSEVRRAVADLLGNPEFRTASARMGALLRRYVEQRDFNRVLSEILPVHSRSVHPKATSATMRAAEGGEP